MGIMSFLRNRAGIIIVGAIGFAIVAFLVSDAVQMGGSFMNSSQTEVGEVDGEAIPVLKFNEQVEMNTNNFKQQMGQSTLDPQMTSYIVENTWNQSVSRILMDKEIARLGLQVSKNELNDLVTGKNPDGSSVGSVTSKLDIPIRPAASFSLTKTSNVTKVSKAGDQIRYEVKAKNIGAVAINSFVVTDPMINLIYESGDLNTDGKLDLTETWIYSGTYKVNQDDIDNNGNGTAGKLLNKVSGVNMVSLGNEQHQNVKIGKAGRSRHLGKRPSVRGVVMNAVDHPHGGGDGGRHRMAKAPRTPWGQKTLGFKTRRRKSTTKFIVRSRHAAKRK